MTGLAPRVLAACVTALFAGGCASSGPFWSQADREAAEVTELRERVGRLETQLAAAASENSRLAAQAADLGRELARLREEASSTVESAQTSLAAEEGTERPARGPQPVIEQSDLDEPAAAPSLEAGDSAFPPPAADEREPRTSYEQSLALLEAGQPKEAEAGFRRFLAEHPTSDLADNAQFWLAESALRRGEIAAAMTGFRAVVENYPEANKVPDALLKVGACLALLGEAESAATVYRELLERFPATAAAETARQRLGIP